jgi:hypothetical protein
MVTALALPSDIEKIMRRRASVRFNGGEDLGWKSRRGSIRPWSGQLSKQSVEASIPLGFVGRILVLDGLGHDVSAQFLVHPDHCQGLGYNVISLRAALQQINTSPHAAATQCPIDVPLYREARTRAESASQTDAPEKHSLQVTIVGHCTSTQCSIHVCRSQLQQYKLFHAVGNSTVLSLLYVARTGSVGC